MTSIPSRLTKPPSLKAFAQICTQKPVPYPLASSIEHNIPVYNLPPYSSLTPAQHSSLQDEWHHILLSGPGVFVTKGLYRDTTLLTKTNTTFSTLIAQEKQSSTSRGDHFARSGKNDRLWNSFSKHGLASPSTFLPYYSNPWLRAISSAWLGPAYRITAQLNIVKPGGQPQICHRDYHLGFQSSAACALFPKALHVASQHLTLQGAVAHSDVPVESGPTRLLPFSQLFQEGYMAYREEAFVEYFNEHWVSLPMEMGDGVFFNPALFHAAGENTTAEVERSANLLQISAAFGKPMETIDTLALVEASWDGLERVFGSEGLTDEVEAFIGAVAEGYPFPTNLDRRVPALDGAAPESEQDVIRRALLEKRTKADVLDELRKVREDSGA